MNRIGVLTSGGDTPGMNAAIRAVVKAARVNNISVMGITKGYSGLIEGRVAEMHRSDVNDIVGDGGTILKTARSKEFVTEEGQQKALQVLKAFDIDGLVIIGGDGSYKGAKALWEKGFPTIGLPGTIDNDLAYTDYTIGFNTAVSGVVGEIRKIRDTMESHERIGVIEVMGNKCGDIALFSGIAGGAEHILVPEVPFDLDKICDHLVHDRIRGKFTSIIMISEGAGKGESLANYIHAKTGLDVKAIVLGYIQRGGTPTADDRVLASRLGMRAVELLIEGKAGRVVGVRDNKVVDDDIGDALAMKPKFDNKLYDMSSTLSSI
jgi:6-phosphofructokinase 1